VTGLGAGVETATVAIGRFEVVSGIVGAVFCTGVALVGTRLDALGFGGVFFGVAIFGIAGDFFGLVALLAEPGPVMRARTR
jgi:hypothetical protein